MSRDDASFVLGLLMLMVFLMVPQTIWPDGVPDQFHPVGQQLHRRGEATEHLAQVEEYRIGASDIAIKEDLPVA